MTTGSFSEDAMMMLGKIDQKVTDLREGQPKQDAMIAQLDKRTEALERQFTARHKQNSDRLDVLLATLDAALKKIAGLDTKIAGLDTRMIAVETPNAAKVTNHKRRRALIKRAVQVVAGLATTAAIFIEPAGRALVEFYTKRFLDRP